MNVNTTTTSFVLTINALCVQIIALYLIHLMSASGKIGVVKMTEFTNLFEIVPIGDGVHYLCKDSSGRYFTEHKANTIREQLVFDSEVTAQKYIEKYLDINKYKPELFGYNIKFLPSKIIREV